MSGTISPTVFYVINSIFLIPVIKNSMLHPILSKNHLESVIYITIFHVLSNTHLDEKVDQIHVTMDRRKYNNVEYDDNIIEYLMKYLGLESYEQLQDFLKYSHIPLYN
jgi:hypothetical protein